LPAPSNPDNSPAPSARREAPALIAYYRGKADECLKEAEKATTPSTRDYWIGLANTWTRLATTVSADASRG
jgi:hypothetical protein